MGKLIKDLEIDPREIAVITPYREPVKMSKETIESRLDSNLGSILREALIRDLVFWLKEEYLWILLLYSHLKKIKRREGEYPAGKRCCVSSAQR